MVPTAIQTSILFFLVSVVKENHAQAFSGTIEMIPDVTQQVIQSGSNMTLTCIADSYLDDSGVNRISWQLPDNIVKYPVKNNSTFSPAVLYFYFVIFFRWNYGCKYIVC
jgi:hypothetical protein